MKRILSCLIVLLFAAPALLASTRIIRYSPAVPAGSTMTLERGDVLLEVRSAGDEVIGTLPLVLAGETTLTTTWTSGGIKREINTTRRANEAGPAGADTWARRHREAEQAALMLWPPDPPQAGFLYLRGGLPEQNPNRMRLVA